MRRFTFVLEYTRGYTTLFRFLEETSSPLVRPHQKCSTVTPFADYLEEGGGAARTGALKLTIRCAKVDNRTGKVL